MSMDLFLWKAPVTGDPDEAGALLERYLEQDDKDVFEPSEDVVRVLSKIRRRFPDDPEGGADDAAPWASWPIPDSDRLIELNIRWSADNKVIDVIVNLAREHGLVLYDPQGPDVHLPNEPVESGPTPPPTAWEWTKILGIAVGLIALTYAAWLIPIGWIRWPAVIIIGFVAAAGVFVFGLMIAGALGFIDVNEQA